MRRERATSAIAPAAHRAIDASVEHRHGCVPASTAVCGLRHAAADGGIRRRQSIRVRTHDGRDEPIAAPRECLDEARVIRGVGQRFAQPLDGGVHPVVEVDERVVRPEPLPQLVASDQLAGAFQQALENLSGWSWRCTRTPDLRRSPERTSSSNTPNRSTDADGAEEASTETSVVS